MDTSVTIARPEDVVGDGFFDIDFHQGHMLVRGGMEHDLRAMIFKDHPHAVDIADIGNHRVKGQRRVILLDFQERFKDAVLPMPKQAPARQGANVRPGGTAPALSEPPAPVTSTRRPLSWVPIMR